MRDLTDRDGSQYRFCETHQDVSVVIEGPIRAQALQVRGNLFGEQSGCIANQLVGMGTNISQCAGRSRTLRIGFPGSPGRRGIRGQAPEPALEVMGTDRLDRTEFTLFNHFPRLANQRVPGVIVCHSENGSGFLDQGCQGVCIFQSRG